MKSILILTLLLQFTILFSLEFITENIGGEGYNLLLIPYSDLFSTTKGDEKILSNNISVTILTDKEDIIQQLQYQINLQVNTAQLTDYNYVSYENEYYPLFFQTSLEPGSYRLTVIIHSPGTGQRRIYRENFNFHHRVKEFGFPFLAASLEEYLFILRDELYLQNSYDNLLLKQGLAVPPDTTIISIRDDEQGHYLSKNELNKIAAFIDTDKAFTVEIGNYYNGAVYYSKPVYPSISYFYRQRFTPEQQMAQLRNVLNQNEYRSLRAVDEDKLQDAIDSYWGSIDPDVYSIDNYYQRIFYSRVMYADRNFGVLGYLAGWQTDRGKIYIRYGAPDSISDDAFPIGKKPSTTWHYYGINRTFIFYDLRGYGNYELEDKWID